MVSLFVLWFVLLAFINKNSGKSNLKNLAHPHAFASLVAVTRIKKG